jgi:8-oxo-dGTP diphosphatase
LIALLGTMTETLVRVVDADQPRSADRNLVQVAVGVLVRGDDSFLLTSRPEGKAYAGFWEFPGGKLEEEETVEQALRRELQEEIGLTIQDCTLWKTERIDYPHALVQLNFCKVTQWTGELQMLESQSFVWQQLPVTVSPVLPGTVPVLHWFAQERKFEGDTHTA